MTTERVEAREALRLTKSVEAMRLATEEIDKKLGDAYPNRLVAEIENIKRRLSELERREATVPWLEGRAAALERASK